MVGPLDNLQDQITGFDKWIEELEAAGKTAANTIKTQTARIANLEAALRKIASCEKRADGDVVDIARKALNENNP